MSDNINTLENAQYILSILLFMADMLYMFYIAESGKLKRTARIAMSAFMLFSGYVLGVGMEMLFMHLRAEGYLHIGIIIISFLILFYDIIARSRRDKNSALFYVYFAVLLYITIFFRFGMDLPWIKMDVKDFLTAYLPPYDLEELRHMFLNIAMFVPLGMSYPLLADEKRYIRYIICGTVFSAIIESIQLRMSMGECDIADIIGNTIGMAIGMLLYRVAEKMRENYVR